MKGLVLAAATAITFCLGAGAPASAAAAAVTVVAGPDSQSQTYDTAAVALPAGQALNFANLDTAAHNVVACRDTANLTSPSLYTAIATGVRCSGTQTGPDTPACTGVFAAGQCPLFWSKLVSTGTVTPVYGADRLPPGTYMFYCTIHAWMTGVIQVN